MLEWVHCPWDRIFHPCARSKCCFCLSSSKADFQHLVPRLWSDIQIRCCNLTENTSEEHKENLGDRQVPQFTSPFPGCVSVGDAQHWQVKIGSISVVVLPILVWEDCKPFQLGKDSEIAVLLSVPVKSGGRGGAAGLALVFF